MRNSGERHLVNWPTKTYAHGGNAGDIIASLPLIRAAGGGRLYLRLDVPANYSMRHPCGSVRLTAEMASSLLPLLRGCDYLSSVGIWNGEPIDLDLDAARDLPDADYRRIHLARMYAYAFPGYSLDLCSPWLTVPSIAGDYFVINRTLRYRSPWIDYGCLASLPCVFVGLESEHSDFERRYFRLPYRPCSDLAEVAGVIAGSWGFVGNQSCAWWIAEGLKVRRVLEVCPECPNSGPCGANAYEIWTETGFRAAVGALKNPAC